MNYFPVSGVSGKIKVDGEKVDLKDIELVTASAEDKMFALLPHNFNEGSVVVLNGEIHILGSQIYNGSSRTYYNTHYKWDDGTWVQVSTLPYTFAAGAAVVLNGEIHILGGYNNAGHYKWNGSTWTQASNLPYAGRWVKAVVLNDEIHLLGAYDSPDTQKHYKWDGSVWTEVSTLPYGFTYGTAVVLDNEIHALGIGIANADYHYKWDGSTWEKVSDMPFVSQRGSAVVLDDEIHYMGYDGSNKHYKWNGSTWEQLPKIYISGITWNFMCGGAAVYENGIHVMGGSSNNYGSKFHARLQVKNFTISVKKNDIIDESEHKTIAQLSDGERLLLGLLGKRVQATVSANDAQNAQPTSSIFFVNDTSNISSVNCTVGGNNSYVHAYVFGAAFTSIGTAERETNGSTTFTVEVSQSAYSTTQPEATITINSFTTTDGKVHTADNLNY